jgi:catechol 2,3-dioxygenase-like lactoylglutathione lyase family enzyme
MASIAAAAPQFLVDRLDEALTFYERRLGFSRDFVYADFYAGVSRDGAVIHLKCAPKLEAERVHRRSGEHLDAYLVVSGLRALHDEFVGRGVPILKPLGERPWGTRDFYVEDPDGYILCFAEAGGGARPLSRASLAGARMHIERIEHIQLAMPAGREEAARSFYSSLLEIPEVPKPPHLAKRGGVWFERGEVKVHLGIDGDFRPARKAHPALLVRGLTLLVGRLRAAGIEVTDGEPLQGYDHVYVSDPFGNRIELMEPSDGSP